MSESSFPTGPGNQAPQTLGAPQQGMDVAGSAGQPNVPQQMATQNGAPQNAAPQNPGQQAPAGQGGAIGAGTPQPQGNNLQRDPDEWATADEPMTEAQKSYLDTLAREAGETLPATLTKAEASKHIDRLQKGSNRVQ